MEERLMDLETVRAFYAEEVRFAAHVKTPALAAAFAKVPRERFLPPGPWRIAGGAGLSMDYWTTESADPRHLYHNVAVAIDADRQLNNGHPSSLAVWMDALELRAGSRVLHVGCGTGYYAAILAETVGPAGAVAAVEADAELAERARANLAYLPQVEVICADGSEVDAGSRDAIFVNAGATHPAARWLDRLAPAGSLVLPLTMTSPGLPWSSGMMLHVGRLDGGFAARFFSPVAIYPLSHGRSDEWNGRLQALFGKRRWSEVRSLRRDAHTADGTCVAHGEGLCLSQQPPAGAATSSAVTRKFRYTYG
jgi:protein-L-isoaspartate(D-aspartate) O-methyltransferase